MDAAQRLRRDAFLRAIGTRPLVMGILNVTPDSFSDGGQFAVPEAAAAHAAALYAEGADIVDIGGESTRPGAAPVPAADELARIEPVLAKLAGETAIPVSIDTSKAAVAARAVALGAIVINDVWGLQHDPAMADAAAAAEAAVVLMHNRTVRDESLDIFADMCRAFERSLAHAARAGILAERIILDPGIGFGKTSRQNRQALRRVPDLAALFGRPILIGLSRKKYLGSLGDGSEASLPGILSANVAAALAGAAIFRVHDVGPHVRAFRVLQALRAT